MLVILWEFETRPEHREVFERAYGPDGEWARLFRRCEGYVGTQLLRDSEQPGRYVTVDSWRLPDHYTRGMASLATAYQELDARCAGWTTHERKLGHFLRPE